MIRGSVGYGVWQVLFEFCKVERLGENGDVQVGNVIKGGIVRIAGDGDDRQVLVPFSDMPD